MVKEADILRKAIGIDLGGTKISGGIVNAQGEIIERIERDTGKKVGSTEVLNRLALVINELLGKERDIVGIGIGSPGFIDTIEGKVLTVGGNIYKWAFTDIRGNLSRVFPQYQIFVGNDANVAGLCEGWIGASKDLDSFIMMTLGTGVGGCIYTKNEGIWHGKNFQAGELGHAILYPNGRKCTCGQKGCLEQYISGTGIENSYKEQTGMKKRGEDIFSTYNTDENSKKVIEDFAFNLSVFISTMKNAFDPQGLVIGGGIINSRDIWWDLMIENYKNYVNDTNGMTIVPAIYLNDAGIIGASKLAFDNINEALRFPPLL